jgi:hypothetical protein
MKRSYSRRELYALGEPLGDSATYRKVDGGLILGEGGGGGGGGSSNQTSSQTQTTDLPDWAKPYAKDVMAKGAALTDVNQNPYQTYGGQRIAGFTPMQQQAQQGAADMQPSQQLGLGSGLAGVAGLGALGTNYQSGDFYGGRFGNRQAAQYMSPYIEQSMQPQLREAERSSQILGNKENAQAVGAGAFGGSRNAIMNAERERNLGMLQGDIRSKGYQTAYEQAANQFNQDSSRGLQAQQLGEQSRQYGAGLGMQGLQTALQSANTLGQLGQTQYSQGMGINQLQNQYGGQQQAQTQRGLDTSYQDFLNQQNYPYKQLGFMSDLVRGMPLGQKSTSTLYEAPGSALGQIAGLGMGAYGLSKMGGFAEGGLAYAGGGDVTNPQNVESILSKLSDQQLQQAKEAALNRRDVNEAQMIDAEIAQRASMRGANLQMPQGIAPALPEQFADDMEQNMATGGIVAFADRGEVKEMPEKATSTIGDILDSIGVTGGLNALRESYYKSREGEKRIEGAENMYPGPAEALRPSERARRIAAGDTLFKGPQDVKPMTPAEIEAANAEITKSKQPSAPTTSKAGAGRGSYKDYDPSQDIKAPSAKPARSLEDVMAGPKPSKAAVKSAVEQLAEKQGLSGDAKDDVMANALRIREEFDKQNKPILDKLNAAIEAQKPDEKALKERGFNQALTQFGFGMAERASKPGARFLESASGAAPVIGTIAEKTNNLIDTQKQNHAKLQMDQARYEVSLAKGDMQTAATLAGQIRQGQQQDKLLQFHIADAQDKLKLEREKLASQNAYQQNSLSRYETVGSLTRDIMQNEGLPYDKALEKAAKMLKPAGYAADVRAGVVENTNLEKALALIDKKFMLLPMMSPKDPAYAGKKAEYDSLVRAAHIRYGKETGGQAGTAPPSLAQKGFKLLGTE